MTPGVVERSNPWSACTAAVRGTLGMPGVISTFLPCKEIPPRGEGVEAESLTDACLLFAQDAYIASATPSKIGTNI